MSIMDAASHSGRDRDASPSPLSETLAAIVESSDDAILTKNLDGIITTWNAGAARIFGYTAAEVIGRPVTMLMPPDRVNEEPGILERIRRGERVEPYETVRRRKDGTLLDISLAVSPIRDAGGNVIGASKIARDITERKRVFALIACQKEALELAATGAPLTQTLGCLVREIENQSRQGAVVAIHALDETGTHFVNTVAPGLPPSYAEAVDGMEVRSAAGPCCAAVTGRRSVVVADVAASKEFASFAAFALPLGIRAGWSAPIFSSGGVVLGTIATYYRDLRQPRPDDELLGDIATRTAAIIIERTRSEESLRNNEARSAAEAHALARLNELSSRLWRMRSLREGLEEMLTATIELLGADLGNVQMLDGESGVLVIAAQRGFKQDFLEFFREVSAEDDSACGRALRLGERVVIEDVETDAAFEPLRPIARGAGFRAVLSIPLITRDGTPLGMLSTHFRDVRRPTDQDLRRLDLYARQASDFIERCRIDEALREADRRKDEFLATLSHELRTPLNAILGWSQMLRSGTMPHDVQRRALESLERNARAEAQLVEDMLDVSRIISGKLTIEAEVVDVAAVIAAAIETVKPTADGKGVALHVALEPDAEILITGDGTRLRQVVWNLLSNAIKFTPSGGRIDLALERIASRAEIVIRDTGQGIEPAFLPRVFERFQQADSSPARRHGGLGLGLAIVRHLVEAHGGTVRAESPGIGHGATFTVSLPMRAVPQRPTRAMRGAERTGAARLSGARALVVDDEADARELMRYVLETRGAHVSVATTMLEALDLLARETFDVLIADLGMPEQDGYALIRAIRALPESGGCRIPAIAVTAYASLRDRDQALTAGYNCHLAKPVDPDALVEAVVDASGLQTKT
jgi:PAS domain S-box-containing protein